MIKLITDNRKGVSELLEEFSIVDEIEHLSDKLEITIYYYGEAHELIHRLKTEYGLKIYDWKEYQYKMPRMVRLMMEEMRDDLFSNRKEK